MDQEKLSLVVDRMYEAAARPELWRPVLHELAMAVDGRGAQLLYHRPQGAALHTASESLDEVLDAFFREGWHINNPREVRARRRRVGLQEIVTDADLFTKEELDQEPWQRDFLDRFGLRWFASFGAMPFEEIAPVILTIERPAAREPFSRGEITLLQTIVAHVQRASQLSLAVAAAAEAGLLDGLDRMHRGAMLLDDIGRVVALNASAERQLKGGLSIRSSRLKALSRTADNALQALMASVTAAPPFREKSALDAVAVPRAGGRPIIVQAAPLVNSARDFFQQARALVILQDLDQRPEPDPTLLNVAFGLTPTEARIAQAIASGRRPADIAAKLAVSLNTVRTHLREIFAKTNTHSQSELAVMLSRMAGAEMPTTSIGSGQAAAAILMGPGK
jgi:DNA-binding CsgD family transcriptional regulator